MYNHDMRRTRRKNAVSFVPVEFLGRDSIDCWSEGLPRHPRYTIMHVDRFNRLSFRPISEVSTFKWAQQKSYQAVIFNIGQHTCNVSWRVRFLFSTHCDLHSEDKECRLILLFMSFKTRSFGKYKETQNRATIRDSFQLGKSCLQLQGFVCCCFANVSTNTYDQTTLPKDLQV